MSTDITAQADALERQVQALRLVAADTELPRLAGELREVREHARRIRSRVQRAQAELDEVRGQAATLRHARAVRLRELANAGAPLSALAAHAGTSIGAVRGALDAPDLEALDDDEGEVSEDAEPSSEPEPEPEPEPTYTY